MGKSRSCCDKQGLKKGPWTPEEDQKLLSCIEEHGCGNWRAFPAKAGLQRCGKSCRLRWINYLRPDIKRGKFSLQEERSIIQLHALLGNRWSAIAAYLPSRTDNEIKNYWNSRIKKRLTKMGIDPMTHKPKTDHQSKYVANLSHMAEWESARLEAEARLVRKSKDTKSFFNYNNTHNYYKHQITSSQPYFQLPCLDILKAWQRSTTKLPTTNDISPILLDGNFATNPNNKNLESSIPSTLYLSENSVMTNNILTNSTKVGENDLLLDTTINCLEQDTFMQEISELFQENYSNEQLDNFMGSCPVEFEENNKFYWDNLSYLVTSPVGSPLVF